MFKKLGSPLATRIYFDISSHRLWKKSAARNLFIRVLVYKKWASSTSVQYLSSSLLSSAIFLSNCITANRPQLYILTYSNINKFVEKSERIKNATIQICLNHFRFIKKCKVNFYCEHQKKKTTKFRKILTRFPIVWEISKTY